MISQEQEEEEEDQVSKMVQQGWPEGEARVYIKQPKGAQNAMMRHHLDELGRKVRVPTRNNSQPNQFNQPNQPNQPNQSIPGESPLQENITDTVVEEKKPPVFIDEDVAKTPVSPKKVDVPEKEEWAPPKVPDNMTFKDKVSWENNNEKENNKILKQTQDKKKMFADNGRLIKSMTQINDLNKLPENLAKYVSIDLKTGDIDPVAQLAGLVNPETELYVKNIKQWLKGAKDYFGARVTNFDVSNFLAQLPSLLNSAQGRRLILKQMDYVNQLEQVHNNTLNAGLKHYGRKANYNQVVNETDEKIIQREGEIIGKMDGLVKASGFIHNFAQNPEKYKGRTLMQDPDGEFRAVQNNKVDKLKSKQWRTF